MTRHFCQERGNEQTPASWCAIGSALGAGAPGWDRGAVLAAQVPPHPPNPVGLAKQLAGALRPISKSEVAGSRVEGARRLGGGVCVVAEPGGGGGRPSQLPQPSEQVVSTCGRGRVGGRERGEGGSPQQMAQAGLGLSDNRVGGGLAICTWRQPASSSPSRLSAEKRAGGGGGPLLLGPKIQRPATSGGDLTQRSGAPRLGGSDLHNGSAEGPKALSHVGRHKLIAGWSSWMLPLEWGEQDTGL